MVVNVIFIFIKILSFDEVENQSVETMSSSHSRQQQQQQQTSLLFSPTATFNLKDPSRCINQPDSSKKRPSQEKVDDFFKRLTAAEQAPADWNQIWKKCRDRSDVVRSYGWSVGACVDHPDSELFRFPCPMATKSEGKNEDGDDNDDDEGKEQNLSFTNKIFLSRLETMWSREWANPNMAIARYFCDSFISEIKDDVCKCGLFFDHRKQLSQNAKMQWIEGMVNRLIFDDVGVDQSKFKSGYTVWIIWLKLTHRQLGTVHHKDIVHVWFMFKAFIFCLEKRLLFDDSVRRHSIVILESALNARGTKKLILCAGLNFVFYFLRHSQSTLVKDMMQWLEDWLLNKKMDISECGAGPEGETFTMVTELFSAASMQKLRFSLEWNKINIAVRVTTMCYVDKIMEKWTHMHEATTVPLQYPFKQTTKKSGSHVLLHHYDWYDMELQLKQISLREKPFRLTPLVQKAQTDKVKVYRRMIIEQRRQYTLQVDPIACLSWVWKDKVLSGKEKAKRESQLEHLMDMILLDPALHLSVLDVEMVWQPQLHARVKVRSSIHVLDLCRQIAMHQIAGIQHQQVCITEWKMNTEQLRDEIQRSCNKTFNSEREKEDTILNDGVFHYYEGFIQSPMKLFESLVVENIPENDDNQYTRMTQDKCTQLQQYLALMGRVEIEKPVADYGMLALNSVMGGGGREEEEEEEEEEGEEEDRGIEEVKRKHSGRILTWK